jgi:predicted nucleic acid-binding protein
LIIVVGDTSPIGAPAHLSRLDLLTSLFDEILVPPAVILVVPRPR